MKIGKVLTPEETMALQKQITFRDIGIQYNTNLQYTADNTVKVNDTEYPTDEEAYEALEEMEF